MPAVRLSMDGVTEQQKDIDLSCKARFKEFIYRLGATARWKTSFFVLLTLVIFRMVDGLGEAAPNFLVAFLRLVRRTKELRTDGPPPSPQTRACPWPHGPGDWGGPITRLLALRPTMHESSSQFPFMFDKSTPLGRLTIRLGSIWVVSMQLNRFLITLP